MPYMRFQLNSCFFFFFFFELEHHEEAPVVKFFKIIECKEAKYLQRGNIT